MQPINSPADLNANGYYTYQDYLSWTFPQRVELFRGKPYTLSPAPNRRHQTISGRLFAAMFGFFDNHACDVFSAPFDVRLPVSQKEGMVDTVVQPDICVVCDQSKLDKQGCNGAPDLVVEILSPGNSTREMNQKFELYQTAGVPEYWIVDPANRIVSVFVLDDEGTYYGLRPRTVEEKLESFHHPELVIDLGYVFAYAGE